MEQKIEWLDANSNPLPSNIKILAEERGMPLVAVSEGVMGKRVYWRCPSCRLLNQKAVRKEELITINCKSCGNRTTNKSSTLGGKNDG